MEVLSSNALSLGKCSSKSIWTEGENRGEEKMFCFIGKADSKQVSDWASQLSHVDQGPATSK